MTADAPKSIRTASVWLTAQTRALLHAAAKEKETSDDSLAEVWLRESLERHYGLETIAQIERDYQREKKDANEKRVAALRAAKKEPNANTP